MTRLCVLERIREALAMGGLRPREKLLLVALATHADDDGVTWPGGALLAAWCDCSERQVGALLASLEDRGLIEHPGDAYRLLIPSGETAR